MKNNVILVYIFLSLILNSCTQKGSYGCGYAYNINTSLFFTIKIGGNTLPNQILDSVRISYIENSTKKYLTDLGYARDDYANKGILATRNAGSTSGDLGIKTYFLEYPNNLKTDTVYIDYDKPDVSNGCVYVLKPIKYNGKDVITDTTFKFQPVYVFNKQ